MNYGIYCNTPYQILSALCFLFEYCHEDVDKCDFYIDVENSKLMNQYAQKLNLISKINKVYCVYRNVEGTNIIANYAIKTERYLFPRKSIERLLCNQIITNLKYDHVLVSHFGPIARCFLFAFTGAQVSLYDDGIGSYLSKQTYLFSTTKDKIFQFITGRGIDTIKIKSIYLFSPEFYNGENNEKKKKISIPNSGTKDSYIIQNVFEGDKQKLYKQYRYIYLGQPIEAKSEQYYMDILHNENRVMEILQEFLGNKLIVRPHPRQNKEEFPLLTCDIRGLSWELACSRYLSNDSVLISRFSTAQITPRLLFNIEPTLIFTYRLFADGCEGVSYSEADNVIDRIQKIYKDKSKVFVPDNFEKFVSFLKSLTNNCK